jgi:hypothetical protein
VEKASLLEMSYIAVVSMSSSPVFDIDIASGKRLPGGSAKDISVNAPEHEGDR